MAYDSQGFELAEQGGRIPGTFPAAEEKHRRYKYVTNDPQAVVEASGYFNAEIAKLRVGDGIDVFGDVDGMPWRGGYIVLSVTTNVTIQSANASAPSAKVTFMDDFLGDLIADEWTAITGNDAQAVAAAIVAGTANGMVRMTSGDSNPGVTAADAAGIVLGRNFKASQGGLVMEARVKIDDITLTKAFVGFTDTIALEFPVISNGTTGITATADDAVGFLYDTLATVDVWSGCGVKATASAGAVKNGSAPVNDTYDVLRIEISTAGTATFYQNGVLVGSLANAVTASVLLTPVLIVMENGVAAVRKLDVDYVFVQQNR